MTDPLILYYQLTLGPPHLARIRALDQQAGVRCRGVQLSSTERTRQLDASTAGAGADLITTLIQGEYESASRAAVLRAALRHYDESGASAVIIDAPADPVQFLLGRLVHRRGGLAFTRWAATWADHPRKRWKEWLKRPIYRHWDGYLATGERSIEYLDTFDVPRDRITTCGNPVDAAMIEALRDASPRARRRNSFLFVGRFLRLKNLERFAHAYRRYRSEGGGWTLDLVGFGESEEEVRRILHGQEGVTLHGNLQHDVLLPLYLESGCFVLPSYSENWGLVVNEAMHAGLPIALSTVTGCVPELLREGENGLVMDPFDVQSMSDVLHAIEALAPEERQRMGHRSIELIAQHTPAAWASAVRGAFLAAGLH